MRSYLMPLATVLLGIACGGTTDSSDHPSGGGSSSAGKASGGGSSAGNGGVIGISGSGTGGGIVLGGSDSGGSGGSGGGVVDARCPAQRPTGMCTTADAGLGCQYESFSGCLCYMSTPGSFLPCQKVDPLCPTSGAGGAGGAGGANAATPAAGTGGISAKIALPPREVCSCSAANWACTFGI